MPGQSLESLFANGLDEHLRIIGAKGKGPFLKNVATEQLQAFREQVELISMIGEIDEQPVVDAVVSCASRNPGPFPAAMSDAATEAAARAGFSWIYSVAERFEGDLDEFDRRGSTGGWRFRGLPWEQG